MNRKIKIIGLSTLVFQTLLGESLWDEKYYPMGRWGISYINANQTESGGLKSASVKTNALNLDFVNPNSLEVKANLNLVKIDYFVLPFLNIYGIGGEIDTEAKFDLGRGTFSLDPSGNSGFDKFMDHVIIKPLNDSMPPIRVKQSSKGKIYGGGFLVGMEYKGVFSSLQYTYTKIKLDGDLATKSAQVGTGRLGYNYIFSNNIGVMPYMALSYQDTDTSIKGIIPTTDIEYTFDMVLEEYTPSFGIFFRLPKDITFLIDYAWGDKELLAMELGYRF